MLFIDAKSALNFLEIDRAIPKTALNWQTNSLISVSKRYSKFLDDVGKESVN